MKLFRKIAAGRRREVPLRLFRILDKRFHYGREAKFDLRRLCVGTLGLCSNYSPSQMARVLDRAGAWLVKCNYLEKMWYGSGRNGLHVYFRRRTERPRRIESVQRAVGNSAGLSENENARDSREDSLRTWISAQREEDLAKQETKALEAGYGSELERKFVLSERAKGVAALQAGRVRQEFLRRFIESDATQSRRVLVGV